MRAFSLFCSSLLHLSSHFISLFFIDIGIGYLSSSLNLIHGSGSLLVSRWIYFRKWLFSIGTFCALLSCKPLWPTTFLFWQRRKPIMASSFTLWGERWVSGKSWGCRILKKAFGSKMKLGRLVLGATSMTFYICSATSWGPRDRTSISLRWRAVAEMRFVQMYSKSG